MKIRKLVWEKENEVDGVSGMSAEGVVGCYRINGCQGTSLVSAWFISYGPIVNGASRRWTQIQVTLPVAKELCQKHFEAEVKRMFLVA
jgi:hypothetical protein